MPVEQVVEQTAENVNRIDLSLVVALAALILSLISPIISSLISGVFRLKEKELELKAETEKRDQDFYVQHRAEVIERYINAVGKAAQNFAATNRQEFGEVMGEIYIYVDESLWPLLDTIADKIDKHNPADPTDDLRKLCQALAKDGGRPRNQSTLTPPN